MRNLDILQAVDSAVAEFVEHQEISLALPALSGGWEAKSLGGDQSKLIAVNPEIGIAIKKYAYANWAAAVWENYQRITPFVAETKFPLDMPLNLYGETLIFAFHKIVRAENTKDGVYQLELMAKRAGVTLQVVGTLRKFVLASGFVYTDPFMDDVFSLQTSLE